MVKVQEHKGQKFITIPRDIARSLEISKGDEVLVTIIGKQGVFRKIDA